MLKARKAFSTLGSVVSGDGMVPRYLPVNVATPSESYGCLTSGGEELPLTSAAFASTGEGIDTYDAFRALESFSSGVVRDVAASFHHSSSVLINSLRNSHQITLHVDVLPSFTLSYFFRDLSIEV